MSRRKDGRPRVVAITASEHGAGYICALLLDPYPWRHQNGGAIPYRYGNDDSDEWAPHEGFCQDREHYT